MIRTGDYVKYKTLSGSVGYGTAFKIFLKGAWVIVNTGNGIVAIHSSRVELIKRNHESIKI